MAPPWQSLCSTPPAHPTLARVSPSTEHAHRNSCTHAIAPARSERRTLARSRCPESPPPSHPHPLATLMPGNTMGGSRMTCRSSLNQSPIESTPGTPIWQTPVSPRRAPPQKPQVRRLAPPPARPFFQNHPIRGQRIRLDPDPIRSEPLDQDPIAHARRYRFALDILLKSPSSFLESTRGPS